MRLVIQIDTDNDAFVLDPRFEVERILKEQVFDVAIDESTHVWLKDINGNRVGQAYTDNHQE
jgi:hypothetical protein